MRYKDALRLKLNKDDFGAAVLEYPPSCRHIYVAGRWRYLALPYHHFIIEYVHPGFSCFRLLYTFKSLRVGMRKSPLQNIEDNLAVTGLPHTEQIQPVCMGNFRQRPFFTLEGLCRNTIEFFWSSQFTRATATSSVTTPWGMSIDQWEKWTKEDPSFILRQGWREEYSLYVLLDRLLMGRNVKLRGQR